MVRIKQLWDILGAIGFAKDYGFSYKPAYEIFCTTQEKQCEVEKFLVGIKTRSPEDFEEVVAYFDDFFINGPPPSQRLFRSIKGWKEESKKLRMLSGYRNIYLCECKPLSTYRFLGAYIPEKRVLILVKAVIKKTDKDRKYQNAIKTTIKRLKALTWREVLNG